MDQETDFWGELSASEVLPPVSILREQASKLAIKTRFLIDAKVETNTFGSNFRHTLILVVPSLGNYEYELLKITHGIDLYPVRDLNSGWKLQVGYPLLGHGFFEEYSGSLCPGGY